MERQQSVHGACAKVVVPVLLKMILSAFSGRINQLENGKSAERPRDSAVEETLLSADSNGRMTSDDEDEHAGNAMLGLMDDKSRSTPNNHQESSAKSFTNHIKRVIDRQSAHVDAQGIPSLTESQPKLARRRWSNKHPRLQDYILPPRRRADHLLGCYWRLVNSLYPFLDRAGFQSAYQRLWTGEDHEERCTYFSLSPQHRLCHIM